MALAEISFPGRGAWGILLRILFGGGVPPSSPNPDPISRPRNVIFPSLFQTWPLKNYFDKNSNKKDFLTLCSGLTHLALKWQIRSYRPEVSSKTITKSKPKWAKCIAVFRLKRRKNHTLWCGTYQCGLYKGVPTPPPPPHPPSSTYFNKERPR